MTFRVIEWLSRRGAKEHLQRPPNRVFRPRCFDRYNFFLLLFLANLVRELTAASAFSIPSPILPTSSSSSPPTTKYTQFHEDRFHQQVDKALISVKRILDTNRNPRLAHEDQHHKYEDKYELAELLTNTALASLVSVLEHLGVTSDHLETMGKWVCDDNRTVTMRFEAVQTCHFLKEKEVSIDEDESTTTYTRETEKRGFLFGQSTRKEAVTTKLTTKVKEYHFEVYVKYKLIVFAGATPEGGEDAKAVTLQSRDASTILRIKGTKKAPFLDVWKPDPIDVDMTWLLKQTAPPRKAYNFVIDRSNSQKCKTPSQNEQVDQAIAAFQDLGRFARALRYFLFQEVEKKILGRHAPAAPSPSTDGGTKKNTLGSINADSIFKPVLPLMERNRTPENDDVVVEESPLLSSSDMDMLLGEQSRTIDKAINSIHDQFPSANAPTNTSLVSTAEAKLVLLCCQLEQLMRQYEDSITYIENMLRKQLVAAIGKEVQPEDFDDFMSFYYQNKLYADPFAPKPFCFAIRRPGYYPDGILSIEKKEPGSQDNNRNVMEPVETFVHKFPATQSTVPIHVPLNAATTVQITGDRYLHGWIQHRFSSCKKEYQLGARARQFSCFLVMVGIMAGPDQFVPKDAIVLQNKDEVLIPLLLNELPTAKEFKDAISSMSPEQQQFAKAFREMQLESSVFGVCVVQIKPQLEDLLGLPPGALTKEMQLTQDLLSLFIDYQIPSDLLSYDGPEEESKANKIALVKEYSESVLEVIQGEKDKQLKANKEKADMAIEKKRQQLQHSDDNVVFVQESLEQKELYKSEPARGKRVRRQIVELSAECREVEASPEVFQKSAAIHDTLPPQQGTSPLMGPHETIASEDSGGWNANLEGLPEDIGSGSSSEESSEPPQQPVSRTEEETSASTPSYSTAGGLIDFTKIPNQLDRQFEQHNKDNSFRATIIKTGPDWIRLHQENLLTQPECQNMSAKQIRTQKDKAFDLLDALSRSGSLPLKYSELHVVVAGTHCFENDIMDTVIQDNINPIEKVEKSSLLIASTIHGISPQNLVKTKHHVEILKASFPLLFDGSV